ncbi:unnamed protein product [Adineta ricciae]|uniref:Uncharacterized protein n=1 Tax=Adineta ricciae TaxID=249248 RepID=A0A814SGE3_ADIRI|nr:unnamed protein product [Adineta ricciae]CAF1147760.1 unnamed protein product [Adineta ricciae]
MLAKSSLFLLMIGMLLFASPVAGQITTGLIGGRYYTIVPSHIVAGFYAIDSSGNVIYCTYSNGCFKLSNLSLISALLPSQCNQYHLCT